MNQCERWWTLSNEVAKWRHRSQQLTKWKESKSSVKSWDCLSQTNNNHCRHNGCHALPRTNRKHTKYKQWTHTTTCKSTTATITTHHSLISDWPALKFWLRRQNPTSWNYYLLNNNGGKALKHNKVKLLAMICLCRFLLVNSFPRRV